MRTVGALFDVIVQVDIPQIRQAGLLHWHWERLISAAALGLILLTWFGFSSGMDK